MANPRDLRQLERNHNKDKRRQDILDKALKLCLLKGVADVEMKDIARAASLGRATLYRYFSDKKSLVMAILRYQAEELVGPKYALESQNFTGSGYDKFSQFVTQILSSYREYPDFYRLMGMVDFYYGYLGSANEFASFYQDIFGGLLLEGRPYLFLEEGKQDGSIRNDIDSKLYTATVIHTLISMIEQIAANPDATRLTYGIENSNDLLITTAKAFLFAIRK